MVAAIMPIPAPTAGNAQLAAATAPGSGGDAATGSRVNTVVASMNWSKIPKRDAMAATIPSFAARCSRAIEREKRHAGNAGEP